MKDLTIETAQFVEVSTIVPDTWKPWFFLHLSENAPFSWGDNDRTLVDAGRFMEHGLEILDFIHSEEEDDVVKHIDDYREAFIDTLKYLEAKNIYIDLEN